MFDQISSGSMDFFLFIAPQPRDSGKYICDIEDEGQIFQVVHSLTVLPSKYKNLNARKEKRKRVGSGKGHVFKRLCNRYMKT